MTNKEALFKIIQTNDEKALYEWLEDFAMWFDPGGWFDIDNLNECFLLQERTRWYE